MHRSARPRLRAVLVTACVLLSVILAPAASASGYTKDNAFVCSGGIVNVPAPEVWTNNARTSETVFWVPILLQYWNGEWHAVANAGWATARVTNQGDAVVPWEDLDDHTWAPSRTFTVPAGSYTVQNLVVWAGDGTQQMTWVPSAHNSSGYCTVGTRAGQPGTNVAVPEAESAGPTVFRLASIILVPVLDALTRGSRAAGVSPSAPS